MAGQGWCQRSLGPAYSIELIPPFIPGLAKSYKELLLIKTFSQKLTPPFSGLVHIAESDTYRALTLDADIWEIQYVNRSHIRVCTISSNEIKSRTRNADQSTETADPKFLEMLHFLCEVELPFKARDFLEYWLLDGKDQTPLALLFSCAEEAQMSKFPSRAGWTALPDSVMPIQKTEEELANNKPPVNYRLESLISERAGINSKAAWFNRREEQTAVFPPFMIREDWAEADELDLCMRYIERQAPRLLMLQQLTQAERQRLESCCKPHATEVARLCKLYPEIIDEQLISALRVEARLRAATAGI